MCSRKDVRSTHRAFFLLVISALLIISSDGQKHRSKRQVVFSKNSKLYFRLNGKENVIPWVQIFAHGWAFRINYDLPDTLQKRHLFFKRDIHSEIDNISNLIGRQGYACILHYICKYVKRITHWNKCGVLCEMGKIIFTSTGNDANFFISVLSKCDLYETNCNMPNEK